MKYTFGFFLLRVLAFLLGICFPLFPLVTQFPHSTTIQEYLSSLQVVILLAVILVTAFLLWISRHMHFSTRYVDRMSGETFERYCKAWFRRHGYYHIRLTKKSKDYGADLVMRKGLHKVVVQAKRYDRNIGIFAIQQAMAAKAYYDADRAMVITNQYFTPSAKKLAEVNDVTLIDREDLFGIVQKT